MHRFNVTWVYVAVCNETIEDVKNVILNGPIPTDSPTWLGQAGISFDVKALSPHDTYGYFSIADTDSIKPIDKRARKVHGEYT